MKNHIDMEDKKKMNELMPSRNVTPLNSQLRTTYINESGLYSLVFASRMETAKKIKRWVTKEVLQSIRNTLSYSVKKEVDDVQLKLREIQFKEYVLLMEQGNCDKLKQAYYDRLYTELSGKTLTDKSKEYSRDIVTILKEEFNKTVDFSVASSI
jgi:prophage antirepressor-like protein